ncbi:unnamed protein product [Clonostachys rosea]|uniref:Xylanolytic transcriptional activator regulatory domain-containing protein n=1 Tax=Bionectria ochroleuca TaxID=29856 RepID=A0ABY6U3F0_BIOOC|nr:unnamed protein product [Clonostachys rosea]
MNVSTLSGIDRSKSTRGKAICSLICYGKQSMTPESYIEGLWRDIERLNSQLKNHKAVESQAPEQPVPTEEPVLEPERGSGPSDQQPVHHDEPSANPLLGENPWFLPINSSKVPILIGEVADAAFATRFRQVLTDQPLNHIPRVSYPSDEHIAEPSKSGPPQISPTHARFLTKVALRFLDGCYHIVRESSVCELLSQFLQGPSTLDMLSTCKIYGILALGELFSSRCQTQATGTPGLVYFSHASKAYSVLQERPGIEAIETSLLLCLYSLCINRRHSSYFLASSAVRQSIVMGLHFNLPEGQLEDLTTREHFNRVWWTSYILEHTCAAISSQTVSVPDDEIFTDLPVSMESNAEQAKDFEHTDCLVARIQLAKLTRKIIKSLYGRSVQKEPFLQRVQHSLRDLKQWLDGLPPELQMKPQPSQSVQEPVQSLHLTFNQSMILATRPVLLHMLGMYKESRTSTPATSERLVSDTVQTVSEACIRCARHSYATILDSWIEGTFKTFDFFNTRHLFSAATVLAISSLLGGPESSKDQEDFHFTSQLLSQLRDSGSFPAMELCYHLEYMKESVQAYLAGQEDSNSPAGAHHTLFSMENSWQAENTLHASQRMTSGMALAEPSLEEFLLQSEHNIAQMEAYFEPSTVPGMYWYM